MKILQNPGVYAFVLSLLFFCGCANSERFTRISGGVISEYSAPDSIRLRSKKFQQKTRTLGSDNRLNQNRVSGIDDTLINIWPFFFASRSYWCALWPMIDSDEYGFAIRPFFNKEGDDCSILFPLSAWNTADRSGWVTLFSWNKHGFGFIPLTWQSKTEKGCFHYYTPLFIHYRDLRAFSMKNPYIHKRCDSFTLCAPFYTSKESEVQTDSSLHSWILDHTCVTDAFRNEWHFRYRNGNAPGKIPGDNLQLLTLQKLIFAQAKIAETRTHGIFPLWHYSSDDRNQCNFNVALFLAGYKKEKHLTESKILEGLLWHRQHRIYPAPFSKNKAGREKEKSINIFPFLLSGTTTEIKYKNTPGSRYDIFSKLKPAKYNEPFSAAVPRLNKQLAKLNSTLSLPPQTKDWNTFYLFRKELADKEKFETELHKKVINPLFILDKSPERSLFLTPLLLTGSVKKSDSSSFVSIPIMTFIFKSPDRSRTAILPPVIYYQGSRKKERISRKIYPSDCKWGSSYNVVEENNSYSMLGLFYRGRHAFTVTKNGFDAQKAEYVRWNTLETARINKQISNKEKQLQEQELNAGKWKPQNKIEHYKKLIKIEELNIEKKKLSDRKAETLKRINKIQQYAKSLKYDIPLSAFTDRKAAEKELEKFFDHVTQLRWKEDIGSGLFFRKEKFYNGDYNWKFCGILAGGEKNGSKKSTHILHLLYRHRQEENREETLIFPFISRVREGEQQRTSFLWRLFSIGSRNGRTGGHIFFIPFGERLK